MIYKSRILYKIIFIRLYYIMLIPELDKLRNKEMSFGCYCTGFYDWLDETVCGKFIGTEEDYIWTDWIRSIHGYILYNNEIKFVKWIEAFSHPLTWWRICYINRKEGLYNMDVRVWFRKIEDVFQKYRVLYDQNELQRMEHEKWPELKELLIQFTSYIWSDG